METAGLTPGSSFGHYRLRALVGRGGMGEVYEAYDTSKDRVVAIKILAPQFSGEPEFRERFLRESRAAAKLQEPHVIPIHDWGEIEGRLYIDMRLVEGRTVADLLKSGPLEPARAVAIVGQIATALDAAHAQGLIHRDVKPQNIIVTNADFAYLLDFGIAEQEGASRLTLDGSQIGTLQYMAPERFSDQPTTAAVDEYALTCVLYEALTGKSPFPLQTAQAVIAAHINTPPPQPSAVNPAVPAALDAVVTRGLAKDPDDRYGTAGALGRAAARALAPSAQHTGPQPFASAETVTPPPTAPLPAAGPRWQTPALLAAAGVGLFLLAVAVTLLLVRDRTPAPSASPAAPAAPAAPVPNGAAPLPGPVRVPASPAPPPRETDALPLGAVPPPLVEGPDQSASHETCDLGYSMNSYSGPGSHAGRGTPNTSCFFAGSVLSAYWTQYGRPTRDQRTVFAPGAVDCRTVEGAACNGADFVLDCQAYGNDDWVTCTGGNNARVYLY